MRLANRPQYSRHQGMALRRSEGRHQAFIAEGVRRHEAFNRGDRFEGRPPVVGGRLRRRLQCRLSRLCLSL